MKAPNRKSLNGVSHNFGHSFISLMNHIDDDYFLGHLLKQARRTNKDNLEVDILNRTATPEELLIEPVQTSIKWYIEWFPKIVEMNGSKMEFIKSATVTIEFDLTQSRPYQSDNSFIENPFKCEVIIIDDRGKQYSKKHEGWWFPEA